MSRRIFFILLSILLFLPLITLVPKVFAQYGTYSVSGYVFDDRNANGRQDFGEMGIAGKKIYADNSGSQYSTTTNQYGYFQFNVPNGAHSIEIAAAGAQGSMPTTTQKFPVSGPSGSLAYGIQRGGYAVEGRVTDCDGYICRPLAGATVYVDSPSSGNTVTTDQNGYYRIDNVWYDESRPVYGVSGGHNIYVLGYDGNSVLVNPQYQTVSMPANFTVRTDQVGPSCGPTYARDPYNPSNCAYFQNSCALPAGWVPVGSCTQYTPTFPTYPSQQCPINQPAGSAYQGCSGNQQLCTLTPTYGTNCQVYNVATNCQPLTPGVCGYQGGGFYQPTFPTNPQCSPGQQAGQSYYGCDGQQYCLVTPRYNSTSCSTYNDYSNCQYVAGQCNYQSPQYGCPPGFSGPGCGGGSYCPPGFSGPGCGTTYSADTSYLQGQTDGGQSFQDLSRMNQPNPVYDYGNMYTPQEPSYYAPSPDTYGIYDTSQYQSDWNVYSTSYDQGNYFPMDTTYYDSGYSSYGTMDYSSYDPYYSY